MSNTNNQQLSADLAAQQATLSDRERAVTAREQKLARDGAVEFANALVADGRLLPRNKSRVVELQLSLQAAQPVAFAGDDGSEQTKPAVEIFRELMLSLPQQIDFSQKSDVPVPGESAAAVSFSSPPGAHVDTSGLAQHEKALQYQRAHPGTAYLDAVRAVGD